MARWPVQGNAGLVAEYRDDPAQRAGGVFVVVHDKNSASGVEWGPRQDPAPGAAARDGRFGGEGQPHDHLGSPVRALALGLDAPAVHFDQRLDERQTDAHTLAVHFRGSIDLDKHLEHPLKHICWDTDPGVLDRQEHVAVGLLHDEPDSASLGCVLVGVVEEIQNDLRERCGSPSKYKLSLGMANRQFLSRPCRSTVATRRRRFRRSL